ncbi:MAG: hypothetical protein AAFQ64_20835, partial [Pseudomonadota bacterium]
LPLAERIESGAGNPIKEEFFNGISPDLPNAALCPNGCNVRRADICLLEDGPELPSAKIGDSAMRFAESGQLNSVWGCLRLKERRAHWFCGHVDCAIARQLDN